MDGTDPATEWQGLHPVEEIITLLNPAQRLDTKHQQLAVFRGGTP